MFLALKAINAHMGRAICMQTKSDTVSTDFRMARASAERKDKSLRPKAMSLAEAVKLLIKNGDHVAIGGSLYTRTPFATIYEILRQDIQQLTVSRGLTGFEADLLVVGAMARKVVTSWWSPGYAWGLSKVMRTYIEGGKLEFEEWSHSTLGLRYKAAAMGLTFLPTLSLMGADLYQVNNVKELECPFTSEKLLLVPALYPDVSIIHAHRADQYGNVQIDGYPFMDQDMARASKNVIVTAEEVVDTEEFRRTPERTIIPYFCVDAVIETPFGAYPGECWNEYEADFDHLTRYSERVTKDGMTGVRQYLEEFVYSKNSFEDFLDTVGAKRLLQMKRAFKDVGA